MTTSNAIAFKTSITRNMRDGWEAKTIHELPDMPGRALHITTSKASGGVSTSFTVMLKDGSFWTWDLFGDFRARDMHKGARATEKTLATLQAQALDKVPDMLPAIAAHYAAKQSNETN